MTLRLTAAVATAVLAVAACGQAPAPGAKGFPGDENREQHQRASDVVKALELAPGAAVADVGAGSGYYTVLLSKAVGPAGKVVAEEIADIELLQLRMRVQRYGLRNVEVIKGDAGNPRLAAGTFASALVINTYHHFTEPAAMAGKIFQALKPGGRLVVADFSLPSHRGKPRQEQMKIHEIDPALVEAELLAAGFQVGRREDVFLKRIPGAEPDRIGSADMWLIVAIRPKVVESK